MESEKVLRAWLEQQKPNPGLRKDATKFTKKENEKYEVFLDFNYTEDFDNANRFPISGQNQYPTIRSGKGIPVWDLKTFKFLNDQTPDTVNPSLWRNSQLCLAHGLFEVVKGQVYQVRAYDLSNITFISGKAGWIVFDVLISAETAKASFQLLLDAASKDKSIPQHKKISAIVYSHSHVDHFGGTLGLVTEDQVGDGPGKVQIYAPSGFSNHAKSENVTAGNAMTRRSMYMYGLLMLRDKKGLVNSGLEMTLSTGTASLVLPTTEIEGDGEKIIDGIRMEFQLTPHTEAPSEMNTFFPETNWLWMAENTTNTMHNILTLRGAQVRDSLAWAKYIQKAIDDYGQRAIVKFQGHHWPLWGNSNILKYLKIQRDCYKYIHDQSVRLMNNGYIGSEISEIINFPPALAQNWNTRGYYGSLRHNSRAVYQYYMGWYTSNPSDLNNLPPERAAKKYIEYIGKCNCAKEKTECKKRISECLKEKTESVTEKAWLDYHKGEYRWVAEVMKHVVFANPDDSDGKRLLADAYEQLGYQSENGTWRNEYLKGASELRYGVPKNLINNFSVFRNELIESEASTVSDILDYISVNLDAEQAHKASYSTSLILIIITDWQESAKDENYYLMFSNCTLNYSTNAQKEPPSLSVMMSKNTFKKIMLKKCTVKEEYIIVRDGELFYLEDLLTWVKFPELAFSIVTPRKFEKMFPQSL